VDLSHFKFWLAGQYEQFRQGQLRDWMLYLVEKEGVETRAELRTRARQTLDFNQIPAVQAIGPAPEQPQADEVIEQSIKELVEYGWLTGEQPLHLTTPGRQHLHRRWTDSITRKSRSVA
ncbi:MAG: hypothetical protein GY939_10235, partial [Actinomycetia bacterium]|nr:hypothetical protein [Actinomycetes bacterium]